jgi:hypothetical protein
VPRRRRPPVAGRVRVFNVGAMVFRQALLMAEADAAVGQRAMPLQQARPAAGEMRQLVALGFPRAQALGRFFAAGRGRARPERATIFFR